MLITSSSSSTTCSSLLQVPSTSSSQRNWDLIPTNRRDFLALVSIATTTLLVFSADPQNASALINRESETKMRARKNSNKNKRPLSPAKDNRRSEQRSPRASAVSAESEFSLAEPRSFPYSVKQQCWEKAEKVNGRDPDRWRRDSLGNTIFRKLVGCPGCLCHDYDHIVPYSKGGPSTLENCQVLQATVNRSKGNRTEYSRAELIQKSSYCRVSGRDMDLLELSAYGNVRRTQNSGGCKIQ